MKTHLLHQCPWKDNQSARYALYYPPFQRFCLIEQNYRVLKLVQLLWSRYNWTSIVDLSKMQKHMQRTVEVQRTQQYTGQLVSSSVQIAEVDFESIDQHNIHNWSISFHLAKSLKVDIVPNRWPDSVVSANPSAPDVDTDLQEKLLWLRFVVEKLLSIQQSAVNGWHFTYDQPRQGLEVYKDFSAGVYGAEYRESFSEFIDQQAEHEQALLTAIQTFHHRVLKLLNSMDLNTVSLKSINTEFVHQLRNMDMTYPSNSPAFPKEYNIGTPAEGFIAQQLVAVLEPLFIGIEHE